MIIVFENIENIISVFFENYSYYLNLVFYVFFMTKKREPKVFSLFLFFETKNNFQTVSKGLFVYSF